MAALRLCLVSALAGAGARADPTTFAIHSSGAIEAYEAANAKVAALEARLQQMERESQEALEAHKASYEAKLEEKRSANVKLAIQNKDIAKQAQAWQARNAELHNKAKEYSQDIKQWQDDWEGMQLNIKVAMEMSTATLKSFNYSAAPEVKILRDIEAEESRREATLLHDIRLGQLLDSNPVPEAALMQTTDKRKQHQAPILQSLEESVVELSQDHEKKEGDLIGHFFQLFQLEDQRHEVLLQEQTRLNATCQAMADIHERLLLAAQHLQELDDQLARRGHALRTFVGRLGSIPLTLSSNRSEDSDQVGTFPTFAHADGGSFLKGGLDTLANDEANASTQANDTTQPVPQVGPNDRFRKLQRPEVRDNRTSWLSKWWRK